VVSPVLTENFYTGGFLISEAPGKLSRDAGIIANSGVTDLPQEAGLILCRAAGTPAAAVASPANTGNATVGIITAGAVIQIGDYTLTATAATTFDVTDPDGVNLGTATAGTAFTSAEINLTVTAGGTACAAGDTYVIAVPGGNYASYTGASNRPAAAILFGLEYIPASGSKKVTIVARNAEVNKAEIQWDPVISASANVAGLQTEALAALAAHGIIAR
jgi:hypothetical protein